MKFLAAIILAGVVAIGAAAETAQPRERVFAQALEQLERAKTPDDSQARSQQGVEKSTLPLKPVPVPGSTAAPLHGEFDI